MRGPAGKQGLQTRAKILEAAEQTFAAHGFDATRLSEIAELAGLKRASMLYYFPDKQALYDAVLQGLLGALFMRASALFAQPVPLAQRIEAMVDVWVEFAWERPAIAHILLREVATPSPTSELKRYTDPFFQLVRASLEPAPANENDARAAIVGALHFVSVVAGATVFFVAAMPALDPALAAKARGTEARREHKRRMRELVLGMMQSEASEGDPENRQGAKDATDAKT